MKKNNKTVITKGSGFCGLLTIAFIVLKLCNVISWSWFWVCFPVIVGAGINILGFLLCIIICIIVEKGK